MKKRYPLAVLSLAVLLASAAAGTASAQSTTAEALSQGCELSDDPVAIEQRTYCRTYLPCRMVLGIATTCARTRQFLQGLGDRLGKSLDALRGTPPELRPEDVWTAAQTDTTRRVNASPGWRDTASELDEKLRQAGNTVIQGKSTAGQPTLYVGDARNGKAEGLGTLFSADGSIIRGQFSDGKVNGQADMVSQLGDSAASRTVAEFKGGVPSGKGLSVLPDDGAFDGTFTAGKPSEGRRSYADGKTFVGRLDTAGQRASGRTYDAEGALVEEGEYARNELMVGHRFAADGAVQERVDRLAEQRLAAQRERETAAKVAAEQAQRAQQEAKEKAFQDRLQKMNPGQLYAQADALAAAGDTQKSREVLRALVSRFPNHALAAEAARQMSASSSPRPADASAAASLPGQPARAAGATRARAVPTSCDQVTSYFEDDAGTRAAYQAMEQAVADGRASAQAQLEQRLWFATMVQRVAAEHPVCARDKLKQKLQADLVAGLRSQCQCGDGRPVNFDMARVNTALRNVGSDAGHAPVAASDGDACRHAAIHNPEMDQALGRLSGKEASIFLRGSIAVLGRKIEALQRCGNDPQTQAAKAQFQAQLDQALKTCRQIVATDNCTVSPF
jgi:hypothetical protein